MATESIPEDLRRFVLTSISSVPHLEALLLLRSAEPAPWSAAAVAGRLYIGDKVAAGLLDDLCTAGMLVRDNGQGQPLYTYQPASDVLRARIDGVADLYARHLLEITHLIHSKLDRKAQQFADAFKWRKDT